MLNISTWLDAVEERLLSRDAVGQDMKQHMQANEVNNVNHPKVDKFSIIFLTLRCEVLL